MFREAEELPATLAASMGQPAQTDNDMELAFEVAKQRLFNFVSKLN